ncbi:MAG: TRAP transporter large permease subunit [Thermoanaerobaculia bacterium]|nr:MAG: TRAP transporter large permease subunit [Thermoanaerobaculia bacterium]MBZ0103640.1 TRAP transporter large permease subunit [Thermoanaerobaculia bacterium]
MPWDMIAVFAVLLGAVALFVSEKLPVDMVALLVLATLLLTGLVSPEEGISGFANPATVTVAAMFVLTAGLQKTGATAAVGRLLVRLARTPTIALLAVMAVAALASAFVNNTAAVAVFIPLVLAVAARRKTPPSRLLIPLSYAAQFGGVCTLIGTSTNLLVSSISERAGYGAFSMFEFGRLGVVLTIAGMLYFLLFSRWLLPDRVAASLPEVYHLGEYITELRVGEGSKYVGRSIRDSKLGEEHDVTVLRLLHGERKIWAPLDQPLAAGDVLLVRGRIPELMALKGTAGLELDPEFQLGQEILESDELKLVQALVAPRSRLIGRTLKELDFRSRYHALVLAILRRGHHLDQKLNAVRLQLGDALLLQARPQELERLRADESFIVLEEVEGAAPRRHRAPLAIGILAAVVGIAAFGLLPILVTAIAGVAALVLTRCLTLDEAYAAIDWKVIFLLAGVLPLGIAMERSGAARLISDGALGWAGELGPVALVAVFYLLTAVLTELMSNNATAVLLAPIAISTAVQQGIDPRPLLMAVTFAASTSFSTPVGYQTNAMVYNPGGYRYADFLRSGVPLNVVFWILSTLLIPRIWSF